MQGVLIKHYQHDLSMGIYEIIALKCLIAMIITIPFAFKYIKNFRHNLKIVILLALLYAGDLLCCNTGFKTVPINTGTLILLLIPLWVIVLSRIILKEKSFNCVNACALFVCLLAIFITIKDEITFNGFNFGYIFLFIASIIIPLGLILQKKFTDTRPVPYALFSNAVVLGVISFLLSMFDFSVFNSNINNQATFSYVFNLKWITELSLHKIISCLFIAVCDLVEFASVYIAYQIAEPALLQPIRFTRILFSIILSYILLSETPSQQQIIGAVLIIMANIFSILYSQKKQSKNH